MPRPKFNAAPEDHRLILDIMERAFRDHGLMLNGVERLTLTMDLTATHLNGNPLDLAAMLAGERADFAHDVFGIIRHIDRETGELRDCFSPRFSLRVPA